MCIIIFVFMSLESKRRVIHELVGSKYLLCEPKYVNIHTCVWKILLKYLNVT